MPETRRAYVHVGPPKTGTSYLQSVLWQSADALAGLGLSVLPTPVGAESVTLLNYAVRGQLRPGIDPVTPAEVLDRFAADVRRLSTPHLVVSQEQLAAAGPKQAKRLFDRLPDHEVHLVVTVRSIARQVPSAWQERVKARSAVPYDEFVHAVVDRAEGSRRFWRNQDVPDVLRRWGSTLPPEHVHVVTVPPAGSAPDLLLARYCQALGVDHTALPEVETRSNSSLGLVQVEVLRRMNAALGDRLPRPRDGYSKVTKWWLVQHVLQPQGGRPPVLPGWAEDWCRQTSEEWAAQIRGAGYDVVGDLDDLLPRPEHFAAEEQAVDDAAVSGSAVEALATILSLRAGEEAELTRLRAKVADLEARLRGPRPRLLRRRSG